MKLLERFIEVNGWSTSRKTVLLTAVTLPQETVATYSPAFSSLV